MVSKIEAILFDLDGVLLNSKHAFFIQIYDWFKQHGLEPPKYSEVMCQVHRKNLRNLLLSLLSSYLRNPTFLEIAVKEINYSYTNVYLPRFATEVPGSAEFVSKLKAKGIKTGIVTNGTRAMLNTYFRSFGLSSMIDSAISADDAEPKPSPEGILKVLTRLNVDTDKSLICGDSTSDIAAGRLAGVKTIGVLSGIGNRAELEKAGADFVIERVDRLKPILKEMRGG